MVVKIRPVRQSDIDQIHAIELSSHRAPWSRDILSDCLLVGYDCRLAELTNFTRQIVGYIICRCSLNICHILNLCVVFSQQRQGYGEMLLRSVLESLSNKSINMVVLEVRPSNIAAISLYEKLGFAQGGIKEKYYKEGDSEEDAILLKKTLKMI